MEGAAPGTLPGYQLVELERRLWRWEQQQWPITSVLVV